MKETTRGIVEGRKRRRKGGGAPIEGLGGITAMTIRLLRPILLIRRILKIRILMILNRRVLITLRRKVRVKTSGGGGRERRDVEDGEKERRRVGRGGRGAMTRRKQRISIRRKSRIKQRRMGRRELSRIHGGKCGIIRETDMRRPEFTAWLAEVKQGVPVSHTSWKPQVNQETLSNWEEKQNFKEFMGDHNTAIFPSKKYYDLDAYHRRKMEKEKNKGSKKILENRALSAAVLHGLGVRHECGLGFLACRYMYQFTWARIDARA